MKKVLLYGTGASAKYFYGNYLHSYQVLQVVDKNKQSADFWSSPCIKPEQIIDYQFDYIVVGSWAIQDISSELISLDIPIEKILWFQHNRDRLVNHNEFSTLELHREVDSGDILYAFYDLNVARATFDVLGFLCLAENARREASKSNVHVIIVNASNNEFNLEGKAVISTPEHEWRKRQILTQSCALLPSCSGVSVTSSRHEAELILQNCEHIFPIGYEVKKPIACWEFNFLFDARKQGLECLHLRAPQTAKNLVKGWFKSLHVDPSDEKVVTITLRNSKIKPKRNSDVAEWRMFARYLKERGYFPVVVPDSEDAWIDFPETIKFSEACFNVEIRMGLYELAFINVGVNNGPMHLCALNPNCHYVMYKQIVEDYAHSAKQSFIDRGFEIGGNFPDARVGQNMVWETDKCTVLIEHFEKTIAQLA